MEHSEHPVDLRNTSNYTQSIHKKSYRLTIVRPLINEQTLCLNYAEIVARNSKTLAIGGRLLLDRSFPQDEIVIPVALSFR